MIGSVAPRILNHSTRWR